MRIYFEEAMERDEAGEECRVKVVEGSDCHAKSLDRTLANRKFLNSFNWLDCHDWICISDVWNGELCKKGFEGEQYESRKTS